MAAESLISAERIDRAILSIRDHRVMLDEDLADFLADFMFQLSAEEFRALRRQSGTSKGRGGRRHPPG